jgi:hypothetical protein
MRKAVIRVLEKHMIDKKEYRDVDLIGSRRVDERKLAG